ncbi:MAG: hypothetical protein WBA89_30660 [Microcoleus sp.]
MNHFFEFIAHGEIGDRKKQPTSGWLNLLCWEVDNFYAMLYRF